MQGLRQSLRLERLGADVARHVQRIAHDHLGTPIPAHQPSQGAKVLPAVFANQGEDRLRGQAQLVGDSHTDPAVANVQPQDAPAR